MIKELGSDFWQEKSAVQKNLLCNFPEEFEKRFVLSGRTAQELIVRDIINSRGSFSVYMPSYCCHTMIEPFVKNEVYIEFYGVFAGERGLNFEYDRSNTCDVVFLMNYFGFTDSDYDKRIIEAKRDKKIVIIDRTHAFLLPLTQAEKQADYIFMSPRKWMFANAAIACKNGRFFEEDFTRCNERYIFLRNTAAYNKYDYIFNNHGQKSVFLKQYSEAEELLSVDCERYSADVDSVERLLHFDATSAEKRRRSNAEIIVEFLSNFQTDAIRPIFPDVKENDVPLFFPVLLKDGVRDELRSYLISKSVYCPVHWPLSDFHKINDRGRRIYANELSLICDQRYDDSDILRETEEIKRFFER